ncbi:MAG: S9 family peptidase [Bacteroidetes bacterium]|nr:MAG: S9 family peptidase [Bacteroidota bacterium]
MKKTIPFFLALAVGCSRQEREVEQYTIEQFFDNLAIFGSSFSADEDRLLVTSNETGIYNVFALRVDGSGREQLTHSGDDSRMSISWFPDDNRFLYSSDRGGNEIRHIYMQDTAGTETDLTPWDGAVSSFAGWARDNMSFYFMSNRRDNRFFDLYEMDISNMEPEMLYENRENLNPALLSHNENYLVLVRPITTSRNEMFLMDRENDQITRISPEGADATYSPAEFSLDDETLYFLTDENNEFTYLSSYNVVSGEREEIFRSDWDVMYASHSYNEKYRVIGINEDARTVVKVFNLETGGEVDLPDFGDADISGISISRSEELMQLTVGSSTSPADLYVYGFGSGDLARLTTTLNPEIERDDLVAGEVIRYKSFDGLEIPAILYRPHQASEGNQVPALLWIHGGPGGQSRIGFSSLIQYFVNHGYAILAVNNRGSSGYGKTFYNLDNRRHGEDDLADVVQAKEFLAGLDYVDMDRIGIIGGSYGGYMVMAALAFQPEEFAVGVNIFGVTNWIRTLRSIPPWWEAQKEALYDELGDPTTEDSLRLYRISPLFHAKNVTKPLIVLQGANDPRVLQVESDEIVEAVRANGVPVEYVIFDDEGHGFMKKENQVEGYGKIMEFLENYLKASDV